MIKTTRQLCGQLTLQSDGEADDILFLGDGPLAKQLEFMHGRQVSVRYWITNKPVSKRNAQLGHIQYLTGGADVEYFHRYSEITGYLWTDEWCKIGGHDLVEELTDDIGRYILLEVDIHA